MEKLPGLSREVQAARKHLAEMGWSYSRAARLVGVSDDVMKSVLTGRKTSARVLRGVMALWPRAESASQEFGEAEARGEFSGIAHGAEGMAERQPRRQKDTKEER